MAVARALRLRLAVHWGPSNGFSDEGFHELFANRLRLWDAERYQRALVGGAPVSSRWLRMRELAPAPGFDPERALLQIRGHGLVFDDAYDRLDALLAQRGVVGLRRIHRLQRRCARELLPAAPIARRVEAFTAEHFAGRRVVGVHVRRGDALLTPVSELFRASSDQAFAEAMSREIARDHRVRFFLATDCEQTQEAFVARFPGRVRVAPKAFVEGRRQAPKAGQKDALVDLLLLSRTQHILGNHGSTFGPMAATIGRIACERVGERPAAPGVSAGDLGSWAQVYHRSI